jgi:hypothetical protein
MAHFIFMAAAEGNCGANATAFIRAGHNFLGKEFRSHGYAACLGS